MGVALDHFTRRLAFCLFPAAALAQAGIADKYTSDQGIENDAAVVFAENFESAVSTIASRFTGGNQSAYQASTDRPTASGGSKSLTLLPQGLGARHTGSSRPTTHSSTCGTT